jgi:large subunit ribosomal protein L18
MELRERRHKRIRYKIMGTTERPRLSVYRSLKHIYAQIVDDIQHHTLVSATSIGIKEGKKVDKSRECGKLLAKRALEKGIKKVVFDRGGYKYHGRVKALAEGAREGGIEF